ncbi:Hsp20/alpha crystallin family protein [Caldimonas brevitalea]|uniref:SHSP domain-containing protein n=1 Tax=Caldimonas brevitalea TaxID=413882 RepID=A0A0G3BTV8_9BURK|nr:Hsp20/alpha crystallin family protein [Caldimonas brevitalea]AKJ30786.1 hypothetical protein AAW51_4095 [Caldimonas brevitalea]
MAFCALAGPNWANFICIAGQSDATPISCHVELHGDQLVVQGRKRFERESSSGRWRTVQGAYGDFHRTVQLPCHVRADRTRATYRDGVLRIELFKADGERTQRIWVKGG